MYEPDAIIISLCGHSWCVPGPWMSYLFGYIPYKFVGQNPKKRKDIQGPGRGLTGSRGVGFKV